MAKNESAKTKKTLNVQVRKETGIVRQHFLPSYFPDFFVFRWLQNSIRVIRVIRGSFVAVEIFDTGSGVEDYDAFADADLAFRTQQLQSGKTSRAFRCDEQTFA